MSTDDIGSQHAVVTGGNGGIGAAIARKFATAGARVTVMGRNQEKLDTIARELSIDALAVDVSNDKNVRDGFATASKNNGPVTILVNNAGVAESAAFLKMTDEHWSKMLAVNLTGTYLCTRAVAAAMFEAQAGRIVNIASTAALTGYAYVSAYCAAKHGVLGLTRALALEFARKGITVNAVCPGFTDTDIVANTIDNIAKTTGRSRDEALAELVNANPQRRLIRPEEVADTVFWLCSPESASITGQAIAVAGGEVMN